MTQEIFLLTEGGDLVSLRESGYVSEERLQVLLAKHPQLLPGEQISPDEPRRWLLVSREVGIPSEMEGGNRWSIDHLFLDQDGIPTLVEVKRSTDTRIRREVVGQMLDYAANGLVYWPSDELRRLFEAGCEERGEEPTGVLTAFVDDGESYDGYWERVRTNLKAGRVRMIFVADLIPPELQRIVEFLNEQMSSAEVLAVEIRKFEGANASTLVPRVLGLTAAAGQAKGRPSRAKRKWDRESFFEELQKNAPSESVQAARSLLQWGQEACDEISFGEGARQGSFVPITVHDDVHHQLFVVWTSAVVELYFYWHAFKPQFADRDKRLELLRRLNAIEGVSLDETVIDRRPSIPLSVLATPAAFIQFREAFEWFNQEVRGYGSTGLDGSAVQGDGR